MEVGGMPDDKTNEAERVIFFQRSSHNKNIPPTSPPSGIGEVELILVKARSPKERNEEIFIL
jgi:hypothetical protein